MYSHAAPRKTLRSRLSTPPLRPANLIDIGQGINQYDTQCSRRRRKEPRKIPGKGSVRS
jgi:hypothetical protein